MASVAFRRALRRLEPAIREAARETTLEVRRSIVRASRPLDGDVAIKRAWERLYHQWETEQERGAA